MSLYERAAQKLLRKLRFKPHGVGFLIVPEKQQATIAAALQQSLEGSLVAPLTRALFDTPARTYIAAGLSPDREEASAALSFVNGRRSFIRDQQTLVLLLLSFREFAFAEPLTGDARSVAVILDEVAFEPQPVDEAAARQQLAEWLDIRYGRLDLKGFVRAEREDVSWRVEDLFQALEVLPEYGAGALLDPPLLLSRHPTDLLEALATASERCSVILGAPGSGKSFFLRWAARQAMASESFLGVEKPLAILLPLAPFAAGSITATLEEHIANQLLAEDLQAAHLVSQLAAEGNVIFFLDGLDEGGSQMRRPQVLRAIEELREKYPACRFILTSRISGYEGRPASWQHLTLAPFRPEQVQAFLERWCELYAVASKGDLPLVRQEGIAEGRALAQQVAAHEQVAALATSPLLLTILALVHRAGVRLPDHRVDLYNHALLILVERWNRVRSLVGTGPATPLKVADALRLLGPLALDMMQTGSRLASEALLRDHLGNALKKGLVRGLSSVDETIALFRDNLGLLVEQGPGYYSFLHLTFTEYFAARELLRGEELEVLVRDPAKAFDPRWREVILLAAGEMGILRAEDERLESLVDELCKGAGRRQSNPSPSVPSLLAGLLVDDPSLSEASTQKIVETLIPRWWFEVEYEPESVSLVLEIARRLVSRTKGERALRLLRQRAQCYYERERPLARPFPRGIDLRIFSEWAEELKVDWGFATIQDIENEPNKLALVWIKFEILLKEELFFNFSALLLKSENMEFSLLLQDCDQSAADAISCTASIESEKATQGVFLSIPVDSLFHGVPDAELGEVRFVVAGSRAEILFSVPASSLLYGRRVDIALWAKCLTSHTSSTTLQ